MKYRIKRKIGYVLVVAMLVVMIYPGELSAASGQEDGFVIKGTTLQGVCRSGERGCYSGQYYKN